MTRPPPLCPVRPGWVRELAKSRNFICLTSPQILARTGMPRKQCVNLYGRSRQSRGECVDHTSFWTFFFFLLNVYLRRDRSRKKVEKRLKKKKKDTLDVRSTWQAKKRSSVHAPAQCRYLAETSLPDIAFIHGYPSLLCMCVRAWQEVVERYARRSGRRNKHKIFLPNPALLELSVPFCSGPLLCVFT